MKKLITGVIAILALTPAIGKAQTNAEIVTALASSCLKVPDDADYSRASATFEVSYDAQGKIARIVTVEFQPVRKAGEIFAISAQDAILNCAGATDIRSRTVRVVMRYIEQKSDGPLIMKKPSR